MHRITKKKVKKESSKQEKKTDGLLCDHLKFYKLVINSYKISLKLQI